MRVRLLCAEVGSLRCFQQLSQMFSPLRSNTEVTRGYQHHYRFVKTGTLTGLLIALQSKRIATGFLSYRAFTGYVMYLLCLHNNHIKNNREKG